MDIFITILRIVISCFGIFFGVYTAALRFRMSKITNGQFYVRVAFAMTTIILGIVLGFYHSFTKYGFLHICLITWFVLLGIVLVYNLQAFKHKQLIRYKKKISICFSVIATYFFIQKFLFMPIYGNNLYSVLPLQICGICLVLIIFRPLYKRWHNNLFSSLTTTTNNIQEINYREKDTVENTIHSVEKPTDKTIAQDTTIIDNISINTNNKINTNSKLRTKKSHFKQNLATMLDNYLACFCLLGVIVNITLGVVYSFSTLEVERSFFALNTFDTNVVHLMYLTFWIYAMMSKDIVPNVKAAFKNFFIILPLYVILIFTNQIFEGNFFYTNTIDNPLQKVYDLFPIFQTTIGGILFEWNILFYLVATIAVFALFGGVIYLNTVFYKRIIAKGVVTNTKTIKKKLLSIDIDCVDLDIQI